MMTDRQLGMQRLGARGGVAADGGLLTVNTRESLWPDRWPAIALQSCIEEVEAAPPDMQAEVKFNLPCQTCSESSRCLNAKAKELGTLLYAREELTEPRSSESTLFPRKLFAPMLNPSLVCREHVVRPAGLENEIAVAQAWDLAWSERSGGDYLVCATAQVDLIRGTRTLVDIQRWQRISFTDQCKLIESKWRQYGAALVVIESDASQQIWSQHLAKTTPVPVVPHSADTKRDFAIGVPGLLIELENKKWELPWVEGSYHHDEVDNLLNEFEAFGWNDGKLEGVGEHDDAVMCFWHLAWACQRLLMGAFRTSRVGTVPGRSS